MGVWNDTLDLMLYTMGIYLNDGDPVPWLQDFVDNTQSYSGAFNQALRDDDGTLTLDDIDGMGGFPVARWDICQDGYLAIVYLPADNEFAVSWWFDGNYWYTSKYSALASDLFVQDLYDLLTQNEANIRVLEPSAADTVDITYNSNVIATMSGPGTKTLTCSGKIMASNVVLAKTGTDNTMTVSYGGNNIVNSSAAGTKTLDCNGKYMSTDVVVTLA